MIGAIALVCAAPLLFRLVQLLDFKSDGLVYAYEWLIGVLVCACDCVSTFCEFVFMHSNHNLTNVKTVTDPSKSESDHIVGSKDI